MTVSLTPAKKQKTLSLCLKLLVTEQAPIRQVAPLLETFSSSFTVVPYGKLYYRSLERCKQSFLVISKGNFHKIMLVSKEAIQDSYGGNIKLLVPMPPLSGKTHMSQ